MRLSHCLHLEQSLYLRVVINSGLNMKLGCKHGEYCLLGKMMTLCDGSPKKRLQVFRCLFFMGWCIFYM